MFMFKFLPTTASVSYMFTSAPFVAMFWLIHKQGETGIQPPASISGQVWLVSVVAAAMGLTKIIMWVRNGDDDTGRGKSRDKTEAVVAQTLKEHFDALQHIGEIQQRMVDTQKLLADTQAKSLDIHTKILENMAVFKVLLENHEENAKAMVETVAQRAVTEIKDYLRPKYESP